MVFIVWFAYVPTVLIHDMLSLAKTSSSSHRQRRRWVSSSRLQLWLSQWLQFSCTLISHSPWLSIAGRINKINTKKTVYRTLKVFPCQRVQDTYTNKLLILLRATVVSLPCNTSSWLIPESTGVFKACDCWPLTLHSKRHMCTNIRTICHSPQNI